jgi:ankyrin repeat protein
LFCCSHRVVQQGDGQFEAAERGELQQLRVALTAGNANDEDLNGWTAIHWAANNGYDECVNYCIEMGANVNARDNLGYTPLHYASSHGLVNVVRVLLDAGAMVDATGKNGRTPLYCTINFELDDEVELIKHVDIGKLLIDRGAKVSNVKIDADIPTIPKWIPIVDLHPRPSSGYTNTVEPI